MNSAVIKYNKMIWNLHIGGFIKSHRTLFLSISTGLLIGSGITILCYRLQRVAKELERLSSVIARLETEVSSLRQTLETRPERNTVNRQFYSVSSTEEDDLFVDAKYDVDPESVKSSREKLFELIDLETKKFELQDSVDIEPPTKSEKDRTSELEHLEVTEQFEFHEPELPQTSSRDGFFIDVEHLFQGDEKSYEIAFQMLSNNESKYSEDYEFHWRMSKACYLLSKIEKTRGQLDRTKELLNDSVNHAVTSLKLNENCPEAHKWYAISLGSYGDYLSNQDKIKNGFKIKDHIQKAIELNPNDPFIHHMMGRWSYSVYMLSWLDRKLAATLIATPPDAKIEDALESFLTAERLKPDSWKENMLYIAKSYIQLKQYSDTAKWLQSASAVEAKTNDDIEVQKEIESLMVKYKRRTRSI